MSSSGFGCSGVCLAGVSNSAGCCLGFSGVPAWLSAGDVSALLGCLPIRYLDMALVLGLVSSSLPASGLCGLKTARS